MMLFSWTNIFFFTNIFKIRFINIKSNNNTLELCLNVRSYPNSLLADIITVSNVNCFYAFFYTKKSKQYVSKSYISTLPHFYFCHLGPKVKILIKMTLFVT